MKTTPALQSLASFVLLGFLTIGVACGKDSPRVARPEPDPATRAKLMAILAKADLADGREDKVVEKCPVCQLRMKGRPEYATSELGYEIRFCSGECVHTFAEAPSRALFGIEFPEGGSR